MRAIILAAGMGRRLAPMGWDQPKCLLPCGGITLLDNILNSLREHHVQDVVLVVGYQKDKIQQEALKHELDFHWVSNNQFADTNTLHSLWLAKEFLDDDILLFNADVWFDPRILSLLLDHDQNAMLVDEKPCTEEEVKVVTDVNQRITRIGKDIPTNECMGEYIGIGRFQSESATALCVVLQAYNENNQHHHYDQYLHGVKALHLTRVIPQTSESSS